jgi:serine/threonine protein kinase
LSPEELAERLVQQKRAERSIRRQSTQDMPPPSPARSQSADVGPIPSPIATSHLSSNALFASEVSVRDSALFSLAIPVRPGFTESAEIPRARIRLKNRLGNGTFGCIFLADFLLAQTSPQTAAQRIHVAARGLRLFSEEALNNLEVHVRTLRKLEHRHVVRVFGIVLESEDVAIAQLPARQSGQPTPSSTQPAVDVHVEEDEDGAAYAIVERKQPRRRATASRGAPATSRAPVSGEYSVPENLPGRGARTSAAANGSGSGSAAQRMRAVDAQGYSIPESLARLPAPVVPGMLSPAKSPGKDVEYSVPEAKLNERHDYSVPEALSALPPPVRVFGVDSDSDDEAGYDSDEPDLLDLNVVTAEFAAVREAARQRSGAPAKPRAEAAPEAPQPFAQIRPLLCTELMSRESLKSRLLLAPEDLPISVMLSYCLQICEGMAYLAAMGVVHRTLHCSNVLIARDGRLCIADAGLSVVTGVEHAYYLYDKVLPSSSSAPIKQFGPMRWQAPEVLRYTQFSLASDVWSLGMTLWEVFFKANVPMADCKTAREVLNFLEMGARPPRPPPSPLSVWERIRRCWDLDANARPSAETVRDFILAWNISEQSRSSSSR